MSTANERALMSTTNESPLLSRVKMRSNYSKDDLDLFIFVFYFFMLLKNKLLNCKIFINIYYNNTLYRLLNNFLFYKLYL